MGPRTVPWGKPDVTGMVSDFSPSRTTDCVRWLGKSDFILNMLKTNAMDRRCDKNATWTP